MERYASHHAVSRSPELNRRADRSPGFYATPSRKFISTDLEDLQRFRNRNDFITRYGEHARVLDEHLREVNLLKQLSPMKQDADPYPSGTPKMVIAPRVHASEHSGLQHCDREVKMLGESELSTTTEAFSPGAPNKHSQETSFAQTNVDMSDQKFMFDHATGLSSYPQGDDYLTTEPCVSPLYHGYRRDSDVLHRALLACEARESPEFIRAILMGETPRDILDSQEINRSTFQHAPFSFEDWEARKVGKSQSMRVLSTIHQENETLRRALNSIRRSRELGEGATPYLYNLESQLTDDSTQEGRTMSMRELGRWRHDIEVYSPIWLPERHRMPSGLDCGLYKGDRIWNRRDEWEAGNGTPLYQEGTRIYFSEEMGLARMGAGTKERCLKSPEKQQQQQGNQDRQRNRTSRRRRKEKKERSERSPREEGLLGLGTTTTQCAICGQKKKKVWVVERSGRHGGDGCGDEASPEAAAPGLLTSYPTICRGCHHTPPSSFLQSSNSAFITSSSHRHGHDRRHCYNQSSDNHNFSAAAAAAHPPPHDTSNNSNSNKKNRSSSKSTTSNKSSNSTTFIACKPEFALHRRNKKKKKEKKKITRIIELCKQLRRLAIKPSS